MAVSVGYVSHMWNMCIQHHCIMVGWFNSLISANYFQPFVLKGIISLTTVALLSIISLIFKFCFAQLIHVWLTILNNFFAFCEIPWVAQNPISNVF